MTREHHTTGIDAVQHRKDHLMPHKVINLSTEFPASLGTGNRIEGMRRRLADERAIARSRSDAYDAHVAELNVASLETAIDQAETNQHLHNERRDRLAKEESAKVAARREAEQAELERRLRQQYDRTLPAPTDDAQWQAVRESILHRESLKQMDRHDELVADAVRRYKI